MTYATATNMLTQFAAEEIVQRTDQAIPRLVSAAMLKTAAAGGDMSGYTADEQAATATALALLNEKLLDADSMINGYLSSRYQVPLSSVPRLIMTTACDLARYDLYDDIATDLIKDRYKTAIKTLEAIGSGKINIGVDTLGNKPTGAGGAQMVSGGKVFSREGRV
ncbi:MAG: phage protein Gp36 family protein [Pseudomonadota bacterium]